MKGAAKERGAGFRSRRGGGQKCLAPGTVMETAHAKPQRHKEPQTQSPFFALPPLRTLRLRVKQVCSSMDKFTGPEPWEDRMEFRGGNGSRGTPWRARTRGIAGNFEGRNSWKTEKDTKIEGTNSAIYCNQMT